ncbi:hypothetical protein HYX10_03315 [Candidatus Woesearchaeota archaeon]|nr:hypothetical protein [Candidatus Woesearchaeota archaeon]
MKIEISNGAERTETRQQSRHAYFLAAEALLKYLLGKSDRISTLIMCRGMDTELMTTDYELYKAFGSIKSYDDVTRMKLVKLFENVDIVSHRKENREEKRVLTHEQVEQLRKQALGDDKNG